MDIVLTHKFSFFFFFFFSSLAFFILLIKLRRVVFVGFFLYSGVVRTRRQTVKLHLKRYLFSRKRKFERKIITKTYAPGWTELPAFRLTVNYS
jgi:hypothetical protein